MHYYTQAFTSFSSVACSVDVNSQHIELGSSNTFVAVLVSPESDAQADDDNHDNNTNSIISMTNDTHTSDHHHRNNNDTNNNNTNNTSDHHNNNTQKVEHTRQSSALKVDDMYARVRELDSKCKHNVHESVCDSIDEYDVENNKLWNRYRFPFLVSYVFFITVTGKWISFFSSFNIMLHQSLSYKQDVNAWPAGDIPINILLRVAMVATFGVASLVFLGGLDQVAKKVLYYRLLKRGTFHMHTL
jgi:hypothetical protein